MTKSITCGGGTCPTAPPQEFLGFTVPEGGPVLLYLLLAAVSCFGGIVLRHRRQANVVREITYQLYSLEPMPEKLASGVGGDAGKPRQQLGSILNAAGVFIGLKE